MLSSADELRKQFGPKSGPTNRMSAGFGSNPFWDSDSVPETFLWNILLWIIFADDKNQ